MIITPIASGSSGNCICISDGSNALLIDAGVSKKKIEEGLKSAGFLPENVSGVLVTHEHNDHIKGLGVFLRKYKIPVFATEGTIEQIKRAKTIGDIDTGLYNSVKADRTFSLLNFEITPFKVSHDAAEPVAFRISSGNKNLAVVTDLGCYDNYTLEHLQNLDAIYLEANHDIGMLQTGPYPYALKRRIWGDFGHLCNEASGRLLASIATKRLANVILGHLSSENNYPELAFMTVKQEVDISDNSINSSDFNMIVARRDVPTQSVII